MLKCTSNAAGWRRVSFLLFLCLTVIHEGMAVENLPFRVEGTLTSSYTNKPDHRPLYRHFRAHISNSSWLIQTRQPDSTNNIQYFETGYDGTNMAKYVSYKSKPRADTRNTGNMIVTPDVVPGMDPSGVMPIWLGLSSGNYFRSLTNSTIHPLWIGPPSKLASYSPSAIWQFASENPVFIHTAAFYESARVLGGNYNGGFLKSQFKITQWTNISGVVLPIKWHYQDFSPKFSKENNRVAYLGKNKEDVNPASIIVVQVTEILLGETPASYHPVPNGPALVSDLRFGKANPPALVVGYLNSNSKVPETNNPTVVRAYNVALHSKITQQPVNQISLRRIFVIASLITVTIIFAIMIWQKTKGQGTT